MKGKVKYHKLFLSMIVAVVLVVGFAFTASASSDGPVDIAFVAPRLDITEFFGQFYDELRITLDKAGLNYRVLEAAPPGAQMDIEGLDHILGDIRAFRPDYLVFVISEWHTVEPRLREIQQEGIKMILVDNKPERTDVDPIAWILTDHVTSGYITGYAAAQHFAAEGYKNVNVVLFHGTPGGEVGIHRMNGYVQGFDAGAKEFGFTYKIIREVWTHFDREMAFNVAQDVGMAHPDMDLVFAANSATALGVMEGLRNVDMLDQVRITGIGGQLEELAAIIRGDILVSGVRLPRAQGQLAAEILLEYIDKGGAADIRKVNYGRQEVIWTAEDVFDTYPLMMLDYPEFRMKLPPGVWEAQIARLEKKS